MPVLGNGKGQVVSTPEPGTFAKHWLAAWNLPGRYWLTPCAPSPFR